MATIGSLEFETVISTDSLKKSEDDVKKIVDGITKEITRQSDEISESNKTISDSATSAVTSTNKAMDAVGKAAEQIIEENKKVADNLNGTFGDINSALSQSPDELASTFENLMIEFQKAPSTINEFAEGVENLSDTNTKRIAELNNEVKRLKNELKSVNGDKEAAKNIKDRIKLIQDDIGKHKELKTAVDTVQKALKDNGFNTVRESVKEYTDSITDAIGGDSKFGQSLVNLAKSGKGVNGLFDGLKVGIKSFSKALTGLMANPAMLAIAGVSGVAAGFKWWWDYNEGLIQATRLTADFTGKQGDDLKEFRNTIQGIADTFDRDFNDVLAASDVLVSNWGMSFEDAADVIEKGFVGGVDFGGKFLEVLGQYPAQFKELGVSAEEYVAIIQQTNSGIFSEKGMAAMSTAMDKIRIMSKSTSTALRGIGIDTKKLQKDLGDGSISMIDVIKQISTNMKEFGNDSQAVERVVKNVFGGAGVKSGQEMIEMFDELGMSLDDLVVRQGEFGTAQQRLVDSEKELNNKMSALFDSTGGFFETMQSTLKALWNEILIKILDWFVDVKTELINTWNESENLRMTVGVLGNLATNIIKTTMMGLRAIGKTIWDVAQMADPNNWVKPDKMKELLFDVGNAWADYGKQIGKTFTDIFTLEGANNFNKKVEQATAAATESTKPKKGDGGEAVPLSDLLAKRKKEYEEYARNIAASDKTISDAAVKNGRMLMAQGATWEIYLVNLRKKYKGNADAIKKINDELIALQKQSLMDLWQNQLGDNANLGKNLTEQLAAYQAAREKIAADDPLKYQKNEFINDQIRELLKSSSADYVDAQKAARDYRESSKKEWERYADDLAVINAKIATTTNADELSILNNQKSATELRMQMAKNKNRIDQEKQLTDKLIAIELDRQKQIADIENDESLTRKAKDEMIDRVTVAAQNDIKLARNEFSEVDGDFVQTMLSDMQSVMGQQMNFYIAKIQELQTKLKTMNPDSVEYMQLNAQLQALTQSYETLKTKSLQSTKKMARDKSMTILKDSLNDFGNELQNIGDNIGGVAGDVISATGQMFNGVVSLTSSITKFAEINTQTIEGVSAAGVKAIKAVEKASVILAIIGTIMQLIDAVQNIGGDSGEQWRNDLAELQDAIAQAKSAADISDLRKSKNSLFGEDSWGLLTTNIEIAEQALMDFNQAQQNIIDSERKQQMSFGGGYARTALSTNNFGMGWAQSVEDAIARIDIKTKEATNGFMGIGGHHSQWDKLTNVLPNLYGKDGKVDFVALKAFSESDAFNNIEERNQILIKNLITQWDDYNAAIEEVKNNFKSMFDNVGSEIMDSMVEMFQGGEDAIDHFNETWDNMIENMIKSMLFSKMIQPEIDKLTDNLEKVGFFKDPTANLTKAIGVLGDAKKNIYNAKDGISAALQSFSDVGEKNGLNLFAKNLEDSAENVEKQNTLSGAIKGASQESIDLLAGQTNAVRVNQVESISIMRQQLAANIEINMSIIKNGMILTNILDEIRSSGNLRSQGLDI